LLSVLSVAALLLIPAAGLSQTHADIGGSVAWYATDSQEHCLLGCLAVPAFGAEVSVHPLGPLAFVGEVDRFGGHYHDGDHEAHAYALMGGGRYTRPHSRRLAPFAQFLLGVMRVSGSGTQPDLIGDCTSISNDSCQLIREFVEGSSTDFVMQPGGGVQLGSVSRRLALRLGMHVRIVRRNAHRQSTASSNQDSRGVYTPGSDAVYYAQGAGVKFAATVVWRLK
jgi:hypothetical protein